MLYIIGVSHFAQSRKPDLEKMEDQRTFTNLLERTIKEAHPSFVAEEDCAEALAFRKEISIAKEVSDAAGIEHRFCDPGQAQRQSMGYLRGGDILRRYKNRLGRSLSFDELRLKAYAIEMGHHFPKREQFWLRGLDGCRDRNAIFICGDSHIEGFTGLLNREGIEFRIVERAIGMTAAEHEGVRRIIEYLEAHPDLRNE